MKLGRALAKAAAVTRSIVRLFRIGFVLCRGAAEIALARRDPCRACHAVSRRLLRIMGVRLRIRGHLPAEGLIVCNHLSYLDVIVFAAAAPCRFVAKSEVRAWPVFGWFSRRMGTVFIRRDRPEEADRAVREIRDSLLTGGRVVLFPEGTSSGGETVLPFKSSLLAAVGRGPLCAGAVAYALNAGDGDPAEVVCYWKDMTLLPHLLRLLGRRRIWAALAFEAVAAPDPDRKALALDLRERVLRLKSVADGELPANAASSAPRGPGRRPSGPR